MLQTVYTAPELAAADAQALTEFVSLAILVETFILSTTITLLEEEIMSHTLTPPLISIPGILTPTHGASRAIAALSGVFTDTMLVDPGPQAS